MPMRYTLPKIHHNDSQTLRYRNIMSFAQVTQIKLKPPCHAHCKSPIDDKLNNFKESHLPSTKASTALSTRNCTAPIFLLYLRHSCVVDSKTKAKHESSPPQFTAHSAMLRAFSGFAASPPRYPGCFSNRCISVEDPGRMRSTAIVAITVTVPNLILRHNRKRSSNSSLYYFCID